MTTPIATDVKVADQLSGVELASGAHARPVVVRLAAKRRPTPVERATALATPVAEPTSTPRPATPEPTAKPTPKPTAKPTPRPTPKPAPAPAAAGGTSSRTEVKAQIREAWGGDDEKAISVADCESSLNPKAASPNEINLGLWQVTKGTWKEYGGPGDDPRDSSASVQTQVAWRLYSARGWSPWPGCA